MPLDASAARSQPPGPAFSPEWGGHRALSRTCVRLAIGVALVAAGHLPAALADPADPASPPTTASGKIKIAFVGDSMIDGIWAGIVRATGKSSCYDGDFDLGRYAQVGSGLTRADHYNWPKAMGEIEASFHPDLVLASEGLNDIQGMVDGDGVRTAYNSPDYAAHYGDQVKLVISAAAPSTAGVMWIGLPVLRDAAANRDALAKNLIFEQAVTGFSQPTIEWVPPWRNLPSGADAFVTNGRGIAGSLIQLRVDDGVHFTGGGYDVLAAYVLPLMLNHLRAAGVDVRSTCATQ